MAPSFYFICVFIVAAYMLPEASSFAFKPKREAPQSVITSAAVSSAVSSTSNDNDLVTDPSNDTPLTSGDPVPVQSVPDLGAALETSGSDDTATETSGSDANTSDANTSDANTSDANTSDANTSDATASGAIESDATAIGAIESDATASDVTGPSGTVPDANTAADSLIDGPVKLTAPIVPVKDEPSVSDTAKISNVVVKTNSTAN